MNRVGTAFRAFFAALIDPMAAERINSALNPANQVKVEAPLALPKPSEPLKPVDFDRPKQSEAVTLLAAFQREARLVDFLKEDLSAYSNEQVGAAVREIHRESSAVLDRLFAVRPIVNDQEGAAVTIPAGFNAAQYRLSGKISGHAPFQGVLQHHGWEITRCEIPAFVGDEIAAKTIAPTEIEIH